ncbi:PaaI family thioesterase [Mycolicibacterium palauense]|uniref:PaaI family thioesterase n=1 Tax=Mycolicibacterium palauense TaxID=2034511 RepID=UPI00159B9999|nr:PaaI family thioesterase [Mycolicibacterium palauense]
MAVLMVLADHILGELPYMRRPERTWSLTSELTLEVIGQLPRVDTLVAEAVDTAQGDESFVQCRITDTAGALVAVGTARTAYVPATADDPVADVSATSPEESAVLDIDEVLGLGYRRLADGVEVSMAEPGRWVNGFGILHGGVSACVTELAAAAAIGERNPDLYTAHVHTNYLRPVVAGAPFVAVAHLYHVGRSSAVVEVLGRGGRGELCTVSTVTARRARPTE